MGRVVLGRLVFRPSCPEPENFTINNWKFSDKNSDIFHISAQNIDCGHSLEPPHWGGSNKYPKSQFYYMKVGYKGVKII